MKSKLKIAARLLAAGMILSCLICLGGCSMVSRLLNEDTPAACTHEWSKATCTEPQTCTLCGETQGKALQHTGGQANCLSKASCEACGKSYGELDPDTHAESASWLKTMETHQQIYTCCNTVVTQPEAHTVEKGVCTVCGYNPTLGLSKETALPGDTVEITVSFADNPGILGLEVELTYNADVLTLTEVANGTVLSDMAFTSPSVLTSGSKFIWDAMDGARGEGVILTLTFTVCEQALPSDYGILVKAKAICDDADLTVFYPKVESGTVTVTAAP